MQERLCDTHGFVTGDCKQSEQLYWALLAVIGAHCTELLQCVPVWRILSVHSIRMGYGLERHFQQYFIYIVASQIRVECDCHGQVIIGKTLP